MKADFSKFYFSTSSSREAELIRDLLPGCHAEAKNPENAPSSSSINLLFGEMTKQAFLHVQNLIRDDALGEALEDALAAAQFRGAKTALHIMEEVAIGDLVNVNDNNELELSLFVNGAIFSNYDDFELCIYHIRHDDNTETVYIEVWERRKRKDRLV